MQSKQIQTHGLFYMRNAKAPIRFTSKYKYSDEQPQREFTSIRSIDSRNTCTRGVQLSSQQVLGKLKTQSLKTLQFVSDSPVNQQLGQLTSKQSNIKRTIFSSNQDGRGGAGGFAPHYNNAVGQNYGRDHSSNNRSRERSSGQTGVKSPKSASQNTE